MGSFFGSFSVVLFFPIKVAKGLAHISGGGGSLVCGPQRLIFVCGFEAFLKLGFFLQECA